MLTPVKLKPNCKKLRSKAQLLVLGGKRRKKPFFFHFFFAVFLILLRMLVLSNEVCWFCIIWQRPNLAVRVCVRFPSIGCGGIAAMEVSLQVQVQIVFYWKKIVLLEVMFSFLFFFKCFLSKTLFLNYRNAMACLGDWVVCLMMRKVKPLKVTLNDHFEICIHCEKNFNRSVQLKMSGIGF